MAQVTKTHGSHDVSVMLVHAAACQSGRTIAVQLFVGASGRCVNVGTDQAKGGVTSTKMPAG